VHATMRITANIDANKSVKCFIANPLWVNCLPQSKMPFDLKRHVCKRYRPPIPLQVSGEMQAQLPAQTTYTKRRRPWRNRRAGVCRRAFFWGVF
jgi:hypothetical protein